MPVSPVQSDCIDVRKKQIHTLATIVFAGLTSGP